MQIINRTNKKAKKNKYEEKESNKNRIIIGLIIVLILMMLLLLFKSCNTSPQQKKYNDLEIEQDKKIDSNNQKGKNTDTISIPGYSDITISDKNKNLSLINPEENTVYLVYAIYENNEQIAETKAIKPGNMTDVNLKDILSTGEHSLTIKINTYDIETHESCNGATQTIICTVK